MIMNILVLGSFIYLLWAIIYHRRDKSLTFAIFIEYLLVAILSIVLLMGVLS